MAKFQHKNCVVIYILKKDGISQSQEAANFPSIIPDQGSAAEKILEKSDFY